MSEMFSDEFDTEDEYTDEPQESTSSGPRALREALKREKQRREELEAELKRREEEAKRSKLVETLNSAGIDPNEDPKLKEADVSELEVLAKYSDILKRDAGQEEPEPVPQAAHDLAQVAGAPGGVPVQGTPTNPEEIKSTLDQFKSEAELLQFLRQNATYYK